MTFLMKEALIFSSRCHRVHNMYEKPIDCVAEVVEQRDEKLTYVSLPNGKKILAHLAKGSKLDLLTIPVGSKLRLEMTPYDFEKGRIVEVVTS